ncbi:MAG: c-type cytochrome, partial [Verrucomicrobiales bacterium]
PDGSPGSQWLKPSSVYLSSDQKSVFIGIPGMSSEVMQMRIGWGLNAQNGSESTNSAYFTPYELAPFQPEKEGFPALEVDLTPRSDNDATQAKPTLAGGKALYESIGCMACHSTDGSNYKNKVGPSWKGLYGTKRALTNGQTVTVDEAYLRESILKPEAKIARDFKAVEAGMPIYEGVLNETQIDSLILFIKSLK